jgi:hydroxymethylglutaryl-CoA reductase
MIAGNSGSARSAAPGKVILLGEHAVVYGRTALAASIGRYVEVAVTGMRRPSVYNTVQARHAVPPQALERAAELTGLDAASITLTVAADLPAGVGLGSSAALSVALIRVLAKFARQPLSDAAVCARAFEIEKIFHGFPSGIDNTVVTYGGLIAFRRADTVKPLASAQPIPLVIALGRAPRETQQAVRGLRERWETSPALYEPLFNEIDRLVSEAEHAIPAGDLPMLGALMNANHRLLQRLGVSTDELDEMVALARDCGALGAKLTGGGGGGAVICLCGANRERLVESFTRAGWRALVTDIGQRGSDGADGAGRFEELNFASA